MSSLGRIDVERLLRVVLVLVLVLLVLELVDALASLTQGVFSRSLIVLLIVVLIGLWYLDAG
jgi:hypothetical protein